MKQKIDLREGLNTDLLVDYGASLGMICKPAYMCIHASGLEGMVKAVYTHRGVDPVLKMGDGD